MSDTKPRVVVASIQGRGSLTDASVAEIEAVADVTFIARGPSGAMRRDEALTAFAGAQIMAVTPKVAPTFDDALLRGLPDLEAVALYATGYDFVDVPLLARHGVALSVLPEYSTQSVAEHTIGVLLVMSQRIHLANDRARAVAPPDVSLRGFEVGGKTLGIIGCGRIGSRVARFAQGLGMRTVSYDIEPKPVPGVTYVGFDDLLHTSDVITLHRPLRHREPPMLGAAELAKVRQGAVLLNSSRSALVDDGAVVDAIRSGHLRGYAVDDDVFSGPAVADLLAEGRIVQTGHSAWWSDEVLERGGRMWADHIRALAIGAPVDVVDPTSTTIVDPG